MPPVTLLNEFRPIGGVNNNLTGQSPNATPNSPELALAPLNFAPGPNDGLVDGPNPRTISNVIAGGTGAQGQNGATTDPGASAWLYVFGQFVDHDLDLESNSPSGTPINITVPVGDPVFPNGSVIDMTRDDRNPTTNTIINTTAGYLDLSQLYGSTTAVATSLRNPDGTLTSSHNGQYLPISGSNFVTGDPRVMENPELTAVTTLFMREHNYWVATLKAQNPSWSGDQLYNMARAITTAEYENIIYTEYLPLLVGQFPSGYPGYNPHANAQVTQEFAEAAFRMGHSQVSDQQEGLDNNGNQVFSESLANAFFNTAQIDISNGVNPLLRSLSVDNSQATDVYVMNGLRNLLFAPLAGGNIDTIDLIAIDIQRERDAGVGTLNQTRKALHLPAYTSFSALTSDPVLQQSLQATYGSIDNVDLFMGGLAEAHVNGGRLGQTFEVIIGLQFFNLLTGDRFFWQNQNFDSNTAHMIAGTTLATILRRNTNSTNVPDHVFIPTAVGTHRTPAAAMALSAPSPVNTNGQPFIFP
ncbi:MAG: peroxidase [Chloroflexi bacterium]|nr:peroxidase [Chloroflexota bacterium]